MIRFKVIIGGLKIDRDGYAKLTLEIDSGQAAKAVELGLMTQKVFEVSFTEEM